MTKVDKEGAKCPFCAEEIRREAILCRFCGATMKGGEWRPPIPATGSKVPPAQRSNFTIRAAGFFCLLSVLTEGFSLRSEVLLFGELRGGIVAIGYHLLYAGLFLAMGIGLWSARPWTFRVAFASTLVYTADKALYLLYGEALEAELTRRLSGFGNILGPVDEGALLSWMMLLTISVVVCWWGFLLYLHAHRSYFDAPPKS